MHCVGDQDVEEASHDYSGRGTSGPSETDVCTGASTTEHLRLTAAPQTKQQACSSWHTMLKHLQSGHSTASLGRHSQPINKRHPLLLAPLNLQIRWIVVSSLPACVA